MTMLRSLTWVVQQLTCNRLVEKVCPVQAPRRGGPHYLHRFATERTLTVNTSAIGGNATLLSLDEE